MFECDYCSAQFPEHLTTCPQCGALIKMEPIGARTNFAQTAHTLRAICIQYDGTPHLHLDETISPQRMATARERMNIPAEEVVLMLYDDTVFGSNREGFAICGGGLYWRNDWAVPSQRRFLAWPEFAQRSIVLTNMVVSLGRGDQIGMAGIGDDDARLKVVSLLNEIKASQQRG